MRKRHVQDVRDHNRSMVLGLVSRLPGLSRSEIAAASGLTEAAVSRITRKLINSGLLLECTAAAPATGLGRRNVGLELSPGGGAVLGFCLTLFEASVELANLRGELIARRSLADHVRLPPKEAMPAIAEEARALIDLAPNVLGAGVVIAGAMQHAQGILNASSLPSLVGTPLRPVLSERLGVPVVCENLGNALNMADKSDGGDAETNGATVLVHVAIGLGMSLVIDGRPHRHDGDERALGHLPVPGATALCFCGRSGCLNTLAAGTGILSRRATGRARTDSQALARLTDSQGLSDLVDAACHGDPDLEQVFAEAGEVLGRHLVTLCIAAAPRRITLAGPVAQVPAYQKGVQRGLDAASAHAGAPLPRLCVSRISYAAATRAFSIEEFLINSPIRIEQGVDTPAQGMAEA